MRRGTRLLPTLVGAFVVAGLIPLGAPPPVAAVSPDLVISQVYGGGGNTGAPYSHDYIELFNRGTAAASLNGLSLQYASARGTGNFGSSPTQLTELPDLSVAPGQYILVQEAPGSDTTQPSLPDPDVIDPTPITMSATAGKVALVTGTTSLGCNGGSTLCTGTQAARIIDRIGFGDANFFEGAPAPTLSNTTAALRKEQGCQDTDRNIDDFVAGAPAPRNSATALAPCSGPPPAPTLSVGDVSADEGDSGTTAFDFTVSLSSAAPTGGVTFDISTSDGTAVAPSDYASSSLSGQTIPEGGTSYTFSVLVNGDTATEDDETFSVTVENIAGANAGDTTGIGTIVSDEACGATYRPIYEIQGDGTSAAVTGTVTTEGVVVGDFEGTSTEGLQGFFIQDPSGDDDATTSDGLFVFTSNTDNGVSVGDRVRVTGAVSEFNRQTQVTATAAGAVVDCGTGDLPGIVDVTLPQATATELERYEGMRVRFPQALVISEYFEYEQFGEIVLANPLEGEDRLLTPTLVEEPGSADYEARLSYNQRSQIRLNDGLSNSNPSTLRHPNGESFSLDNRFRGGDLVANAVGILGERTSSSNPFPRYRIEPTAAADYTAVNERDAAPHPVGGRIQVAAMNLLNYFLTPDAIQEGRFDPDDPADNVCGGNENLECRGHDGDQPDELERQRTKLLAALRGLEAEVIGVNELENTPGVEPLVDLVAGLNDFGDGTYAFIDTGAIGTDAIRVGLMYRADLVEPVGDYEILDSTVDPRFDDQKSRPVLAQTFREKATGAVFTVAVNHLKSKGSSCVGDPDVGDGQGNCNVTRTLAAEALVDWLATDPTGSGDPDFLIIGDLNAYAMEDPIDAVRAGADGFHGTGDDYTNLIRQYVGEDAYSYVFDAMVGYLDHALSTSSLTAQVTGATEWHINADEPDVLDYDTSFKPASQELLFERNEFRSSDHDPVLVGLNLATAKGRVTGSGTWADGSFDVSVQFLPGATAPAGATTVTVPDGTFVASSIEWLVVAGNRATFQGTGTLDGEPGYGFLFSVVDNGSPGRKDRIRVRIWESDGDTVYDSQPGAAVSTRPTTQPTGGNVVVHP